MRTYLECIPCFLKHSLEVSNLVTGDRALHEEMVKEILKLLCDVCFEEPPPLTTARMHRVIRRLTGEADPYKGYKETFNEIALDLYPRLKTRVDGSKAPFQTAVRMAIAGNTIDCIVTTEPDTAGLLEAVEEALRNPLDPGLMAELASLITEKQKILYIGDNAGELVFDRLLLEEMPREKITFAVRGSPILNDATMEDAAAAGISQQVDTVDTGSDAPGIVLEECSDAFRTIFDEADLVIAKGQGNFETLSGIEKSIFFLFKVKCPVVSRDTNVAMGRAAIFRGDRKV